MNYEQREKLLARAVVESITYFTGRPPQRPPSVLHGMALWLVGVTSLFLLITFLAKALQS